MKKRIAIGFLFLVFEINAVFSYEMVNDFLHMLETIHNGAQMYQQIQNEIKELEYDYQSTKAQIKSLQQLNPSDIHSFTEAVEAVDVNLTFLRNTEDTLTNYRVSLGNTSYNLAEIYKIPGGVYSEVYDAWNSDLSDEDKARIWSYYGLDPRNYAYTQTWKKRISGASKQLSILAQQANKQLEQNGNQEEKYVLSVLIKLIISILKMYLNFADLLLIEAKYYLRELQVLVPIIKEC